MPGAGAGRKEENRAVQEMEDRAGEQQVVGQAGRDSCPLFPEKLRKNGGGGGRVSKG